MSTMYTNGYYPLYHTIPPTKKSSGWKYALAIFMAALVIGLYVLWAYMMRNSDERIIFIIKNKFTEFGDGNPDWDPNLANNISVHNVKVRSREISATINYDYDGEVKVINKSYQIANPCLTSSCVAY